MRSSWLGLAALLAVACLQEPPAPSGGSIRVRLPASPDSWNPYLTRNAASANVLDVVYPRLLEQRGAQFVPALARAWSFDATRRALDLELDPHARWSDGTPVVCADVAFTLEAQQSEQVAWPGRDSKRRIVGVECPSPKEVRFRFDTAYPDALVDAVDGPILPVAYADIPFDAWSSTSWRERVLTAGPFRLAEVVPDQRIVLERDPGYRGDAARLDTVVFLIHPDTERAAAMVASGEIDVMIGVPAARVPALENAERVRLLSLDSRSYLFLGWNQLEANAYVDDRRERVCAESCEESEADLRRLAVERPHPALTDPAVRRALTQAIDRRGLLDAVWSGRGRTLDLPLPADARIRTLDEGVAFDPEAARERLAGRELQLELIVYAGNARMVEVAEIVRANLAEVGVQLEILALPRAEFVRRAWDKQFDAVLSAWRMGSRVEPQLLFHTRAAVERGNNLIGWSRPQWDALFDEARSAVEHEQLERLWLRWQRWFLDELPYTILVEPANVMAVRSDLAGLDPSALAPFRAIDRWHLTRSQVD